MSTPDPINGHHVASEYSDLWSLSDGTPDVFAFLSNHPELLPDEVVAVCVVDQERRWKAGIEWPVEKYFQGVKWIRDDKRLALVLIRTEYHQLTARGSTPETASFAQRFPGMTEIVQQALESEKSPAHPSPVQSAKKTAIDTVRFETPDRALPEKGLERTVQFIDEAKLSVKPNAIGRYRVIRILGDGGFGRVYLSHDESLKRDVAIKVPHRHLLSELVDVELYLAEARIVSSLDHNSIVPVYDCGHTDDGLFYIVSKYIDGSTLSAKIKNSPLSHAASADLVIEVAEALHYAHTKGIVHRDVKPANILIDSRDRPFLSDFGIALREEDFGKGLTRVGTVTYMSPEQLRGEGHLVDGRSDVFSLGVVLYELLTGRRAFASNRIEHVATPVEPRPPRQFDSSIPKELERICLKAMSYRVTDRYNTAYDMAEDLREFLHSGTATHNPPEFVPGLSNTSNPLSSNNLSTKSDLKIVPKGLRSFDGDDASFFLELLPGPRDRHGLPESVRFWKSRILSTGNDGFRIGVVYGPSGSGKSSFLKAGVLPQLGNAVTTVYIESTPLETETRLLKGLRKAFPDLPVDKGLAETITAIRRRKQVNSPPRILIVLDQFEQWLHARSKGESGELLLALRQCDGVQVQCIITVRDDFWMALTQFMSELEVDLVPGNNLSAVDLFSVRHARKVLTAIGQAYGMLPTNLEQISKDEKAFITQSISDLAHNDQVIPVQLALFAEMVKEKPWTPATLHSLGGAKGVGERFLEETFNGRTALPHYRLRQTAARAVLKELLPDSSTHIKGRMRSYDELLDASGYRDSPADFDALLRILDSELRLISPTEPDGVSTSTNATPNLAVDGKFFHLTHDYLVPSLQSWLTRKQRETRAGRAELVLAERDAAWKVSPTSRSLPSFSEWLNILAFTGRRARYDGAQVLSASFKYYGSRAVLTIVIVAVAAWFTSSQLRKTRATGLVEQLIDTKTQSIAPMIERIEPYRQIANPLLYRTAQTSGDSDEAREQRLRAAMALLPIDKSQEEIVYEGLLKATPGDFAAVRDLLLKWCGQKQIADRLWKDLQAAQSDGETERVFRTGCALATFDKPEADQLSPRWQSAISNLAELLIAEIRTDLGSLHHWVEALRPIRKPLSIELERRYSDLKSTEVDRFTIVSLLADFMSDTPVALINIAFKSRTRAEYDRIISPIRQLGESAKVALFEEYAKQIPRYDLIDELNEAEKRKAFAAIGLLEFQQIDPLFAVLRSSVDCMLNTYAEDRLSRMCLHPELLFKHIDVADAELRASLIRTLGGMSPDELSEEFKTLLIARLVRIFKNDPDSSCHSAAEWALRSMGELQQLKDTAADVSSRDPIDTRRWYINGQFQTMIVIKGPISFSVGSPSDEPGRDASDEQLAHRVIPRDFAICSTEVTFEQFLKFLPSFRHKDKLIDTSPRPDCPMGMVTWYRAAEYCNWLSKLEGIPVEEWCYQAETKHVITHISPQGEDFLTMQAVPGYLSKSGYRMPTETEWEYACRAGTTAAFCWGRDSQLYSRYARTIVNSKGLTQPVGSLCPNRFGFFDMHGNSSEWTSSVYHAKPSESEIDTEDLSEILLNTACTTRGGNSGDLVDYQRSANRRGVSSYYEPAPRLGFRIARTVNASSP